MSALPKPSTYSYPTSTPHYARKQKSLRRKTQRNQGNNQTNITSSDRLFELEPINTKVSKTQIVSAQISQSPQVQQLPHKLKSLLFWQKSSLGLAFGLIAASVALYVANVRIPEIWSQKYEELELLQRQERELTAANESLKHKLAQQAQTEATNLTLVTSNNTIFIPPASLSQPKSSKTQPEVKLNKIPMGY